jgi:class 3 adenylate cyclase
MASVAATLCAGILVPMAFLGLNFDPRNAFGVNLACSMFLFVYFNGFAYSAYNRSALLEQSRQELREGKATLEIEKMRSDRIHLNVVPMGLAAAFQRDGRIEPTVFPRVALLAVSFRAFSAILDRDPGESLSFLAHCFQAIDAIAARHGLEKVKSMGDLYVAVAGLPRSTERDSANAIRAAIEIRDFLADVSDRRRATDLVMPDPRIAVHAGSVVGALVDSEKLAYDIWGAVVPTLLRLHLEARPGCVLVSELARRSVDSEFAWERAPSGSLEPCWKAERIGAPGVA